jgi:hypothetical protein
MRSSLGLLVVVFFVSTVPLNAQIDPIPNLTAQPIPIPGGDIISSYGLFNQFLPGPPNQNPPFDPINADPHGITNFRGITAMGYTFGAATDNLGNAYGVITDIRVYQGEYIGGETANANSAAATNSAPSHGTFVEI